MFELEGDLGRRSRAMILRVEAKTSTGADRPA